jgi:hypothetical protein
MVWVPLLLVDVMDAFRRQALAFLFFALLCQKQSSINEDFVAYYCQFRAICINIDACGLVCYQINQNNMFFYCFVFTVHAFTSIFAHFFHILVFEVYSFFFNLITSFLFSIASFSFKAMLV